MSRRRTDSPPGTPDTLAQTALELVAYGRGECDPGDEDGYCEPRTAPSQIVRRLVRTGRRYVRSEVVIDEDAA